ncbi:MAG: Fe-S protein assembly co-chaperone HscB [Myxococcales bacterium]|mgnify:FL=1|nr:Fe-S protein assembly co-chaperone HscB [Myxococcales bacterium]
MTDSDYFELLGLSRRWQVDRNLLERNYLERSREAHPDAFVSKGAAAQRAALELSSRINAAYRVVRDPILRAEYLVKLSGIDLDSNDPIQGAPTPTQAFLIQMIELRERLSEEGSAEVRDEIEARADQAFDEAIVALDRADIVTAARELVARRYYQRFLDEVDAGEGP